jgi:FkbM family methyltransferase
VTTKEELLLHLGRSEGVRRIYRVLRSAPVLGTALSKAVRATIPQGSRIWVRVPRGHARGLWIYADPRSEQGYTNGDHEPWLQSLLKAELPPGGCYYDVGAHSGFFTILAARLVGPSGSVFAFEPDPKNRAVLEENTRKNGLSQVTTLDMAVWSSTGQVTFELAPETSNRTQGHICEERSSGRNQINVSAMRLDDLVFVDGCRAPDLIKMDVEGAEWEALHGSRRLLAEVRPKLLCEIHYPAQMGQIRAYLEQFGYTAEEWKPVHPHYADYRQLYVWATPMQVGEALRLKLSHD